MKRFQQRIPALTIGLALALSIGIFGRDSVFAQDSIRFGTSSVGSTFYVLAVGMAELARKHAGLNATVEPLGGSTATVNGLGAGKLDVAMTNAGSAWTAYQGKAPFKKPIAVALIAQGQPSLRYLVVRRDAGIKSPADLAGKTFIAKRRALPEMDLIANALLAAYGVPKNKVNVVETVETNQTTTALRAGTAQAAIIPGGMRLAPLEELIRDEIVDLLPLSGAKVDVLMRKLPDYLSKTNIPAGHFEKQSTASVAPTLNTYLIARGDLSEETVYKLTKAVMGNLKEFAAYHAEAKHWTVEHTLAEPKVPFHPGAIRYYKEIGAWNPKLDAIQASLTRKP
ncbi:MAG TPA: TAXI family TRAP transporter solute-binding subunit [Xanthobacteraceae bacterium]|nr:TAXI family TRAP transporter solute-binding subunit [Xanthobacteraceae bacterium]